jgi:hypothetical protein
MQIPLEPKRIAAVDFIGSVRHDLKQAIADSGMGLGDVAKAIGVTRGRLMRELVGSRDITAGRIAEICWAIGADVSLIVVGQALEKIKEGR